MMVATSNLHMICLYTSFYHMPTHGMARSLFYISPNNELYTDVFLELIKDDSVNQWQPSITIPTRLFRGALGESVTS